jgi:hypothetical protein
VISRTAAGAYEEMHTISGQLAKVLGITKNDLIEGRIVLLINQQQKIGRRMMCNE